MKKILFIALAALLCLPAAAKTISLAPSQVLVVDQSTDSTATVQCGQDTTITIYAQVTNACYEFAGWDKNGDRVVDIPASACTRQFPGGIETWVYTFPVVAIGDDEVYTAIYRKKTYIVRLSSDDNGSVSINNIK